MLFHFFWGGEMRITIIFLITLLSVFVFANDFMQPSQIAIDVQHQVTHVGTRTGHREQDPAPEYSFIPNGDGESTTFLINSFYDFMPFSYNGHNVRIQPENSQPNGYPAGGIFISYARSETDNITFDRRAYYSYMNPDGTLNISEQANPFSSIREGFTSIAIDPITADPFVIWHSVVEYDGSYDCSMSFSIFHESGFPGNWIGPIISIDNPEIGEQATGHIDDEFIWPQIHIGPSPIAGHRRIHIYGNNLSSSGGCGPNSLYLYTDFNSDHLLNWTSFDWTVQPFPYFDSMYYNEIAKVNKDMIVSDVDGKVVFFGNVADSLFALYSNDYGETFTKHSQQLKQELPNLTNTYTGLPMFGNQEMYAIPSYDLSHYNGVFTGDDNSKVQWMSGVNYNSQDNINIGNYFPQFIYPKIFTFNTITGGFSFYDLDIQDTDPGDDQLAIAYDLNEDGEIDEYDENLEPIIPASCPSWFFNSDGGWQDAYYHESNCKMTSNGNWVVGVWHDGRKLQNAFYEVPDYGGWVEQPEICIIISDDSGETWSDILYINANPNDNIIDPANHYDGNYAPEFEDMLPVNVTLGDKLEIMSNEPGNYHAKLHFVFMDDGDYGSCTGQTSGGGNLTNSALRYAAIDLEFQEEWIDLVSVDPEIVPFTNIQLNNYPNPFNPTTTISFSIPEEAKVKLSIYNVKGQKIRSLLNNDISAGKHSIVWNGEDSNNKQVSSGIYFYRLYIDGRSESVKKCLLLK